MRGSSRGPSRLEKLSHVIGSVVVLLIFAGAAWLLYHELRHYRVRDIRHGLSMIPAGRVWLAVGLTALNYLILIGYDFLAVRSIRHPLALGRIAPASFTGFATSYNFGACWVEPRSATACIRPGGCPPSISYAWS